MDPPTPIAMVKSSKSYQIISNKNNKFYLTIENQSSIINILSYYQDDMVKHNYEKKLKLEELKENKYLSLCDSIDEIYNELINLLDKNKSNIIEETNKIYLNIQTGNLKVKEIIFCINEIIMKENEKINIIFSIISNLKEEINNIKEENKNLKENNNNLKLEINKLKEEISKNDNNLKNEINNLKEENELINKKIKILDEFKLNKKIEINL